MRVLLYDDDITKRLSLGKELKGFGSIADLEGGITDLSAIDAADLMSMSPYVAALVPDHLTRVFREASPQSLVLRNDLPIRQIFDAVSIAHGRGFDSSRVKIALVEDTLDIDLMDRKNCALNGRALPLTGKQHAFLRAVALRSGRLVPRKDLAHHLWTNPDIMDFANLGTHLKNLRKKVTSDFISTIPEQGYILESSGGLAEAIPKHGITMASDRRVYVNAVYVHLRNQQIQVLDCLMRRPDTPIGAASFFEYLKPNEPKPMTNDLIKVLVGQLIKRLAEASKSRHHPNGLHFIDHVRGQGYRFLSSPVPVERRPEFAVVGRLLLSNNLEIDTQELELRNIGRPISSQSISRMQAAILEHIFDHPNLAGRQISNALSVKSAVAGAAITHIRAKIADLGLEPAAHVSSGQGSGYSLPFAEEVPLEVYLNPSECARSDAPSLISGLG